MLILLAYKGDNDNAIEKYSYANQLSREKLPPFAPLSPAKIDDFHLKSAIPVKISPSTIAGRKIAWGPPKIFPTGRYKG